MRNEYNLILLIYCWEEVADKVAGNVAGNVADDGQKRT